MTSSQSDAETDIWLTEHMELHKRFSEHLTNLSPIDSLNSEDELSLMKNKIKDMTNIIFALYNSEINSSFSVLLQLNNKLSNLTNSYISPANDSISVFFNNTIEEKTNLENQLLQQRNHVILAGDELIKSIDEILLISETFISETEKATSDIMSLSFIAANIFILICIIISITIALSVSHLISKPIVNLKKIVDQLGKGILPDKIHIKSNDEIGEMSQAINSLSESLQQSSEFLLEIGKGNLDYEFMAHSNKDTLRNSLIKMREGLRVAEKEQKRSKIEEQERNWSTEGISLFSEVLRHSSKDIKKLAKEIIKSLIQYTEANQGGIFLYNDEDRNDIHLQLIASFAYNREKYFDKKIMLEEGLVGSCALEKKTTYFTDIPDEYMEIESGLGGSNPSCLLIVPMLVGDEIFGVMEIASFKNFKPYQIKFIEKIAENSGSAISTLLITQRTDMLLEQSQKQATELAEQEDVMRQNVEEMRATQEESNRREEELRKILKKLTQTKEELKEKDIIQVKEIQRLDADNMVKIRRIEENEIENEQILTASLNGIIVFDDDGVIEFFNPAAQKIWGYQESEAKGASINILIPPERALTHTISLNQYLQTEKMIGKGIEFPILRKDGNIAPGFFSVVESNLRGKSKFTCSVIDLAEQKQLEKRRNSLMESLIAKEFEYHARIESLEQKLIENNIEIPEVKDVKELIIWSKKYELNLSVIDSQHKRLIKLINTLYISFKKGQTTEELQNYLKELIDYTNYHFGIEEKYFDKFEYENRSFHKSEHIEFQQKITDFQNDFLHKETDGAYKLILYLKDWFLNHILIEDKKYVKCFIDNGMATIVR
jgi:hemerythrin-like metal-binding protein/PAS domain S-box-containing protein